MNSRYCLLALCALNVPVLAHAGDAKDVISSKGAVVPSAASPSRWRFGASYAPILGLETKFSGLGTFRSPFTPPPLGGGVNADYDDGFVHIDSSDNEGGETWNWGYDSDSQYDPSGEGSISFSLTNSLSDAGVKEDEGGELGFEVFALYDMGAVEFAPLKDRNARWGFRGALQYAKVDVDNSSVLSSRVSRTIDTYSLNGNLPPGAPYEGSFNGPGVLIGDSPSRVTILDGEALIDGTRDLNVDLTVLHFGAYLEVPVAEKFSLLGEGGASLGIASGTYKFTSITSIEGLGSQTSSGKDSSTEALPGFYLGVSGIYSLTEDWGVIGSARYQYMEGYDLSDNGSKASLSFDSAYVLSLGAVYTF